MRLSHISRLALAAAFAAVCPLVHAAEVSAHLAITNAGAKEHQPPAVIWLKPLQDGVAPAVPAKFTLLQKDKMFHPHLLVVPVGSSVSFPNDDPFFHNVFSLFDGRRFDLGLYEAGSTRTVIFPREGVSYIFCNIHPDMSAVVLSLTTPFYATATADGIFRIAGVPEGDYELHVWVEGRRADTLTHLSRHVHVGALSADLGTLQVGPLEPAPPHLNKFGKPYDKDSSSY